jgi:sugar lactone lactonase YvrE
MHRSEDVNFGTNAGKRALLVLMVIAALWLLGAQAALGQASSVIFTRTSYVSSVNSGPGLTGSPDYQGSAGHLAANSRGDLFFDDAPYSYPDAAYVIEIPADGGPQVTLLSNVGYGASGVYVDSGDNLWAVDPNGNLIYVPFVGGAYASATNSSSLTACTMPLSSNTAPCRYFWQLNASIGYYLQSSDVALDGAGNVYVVDKHDGATNGGVNRILEFAAATGDLKILVDGLASSGDAQLAVDPAGDVYYADGNGAYYFATSTFPLTNGATDAVAIGSGLNDPTGVALDSGGNLYISDTGNMRLLEIPNVNGARLTANQFILTNGSNISSNHAQAGAGIDGYGNIYYVGNYGNSINHLAVGNLTFGSTAIGTATASSALDVYFTTAQTVGSFVVTSGPATVSPFAIGSNGCTTGKSYAAGATCTVNLTYTASAVGLQTGVIQALDASGNLLGQAKLSGSGQAALINVDPGTAAPIGTGWTAPSAIAVDSVGNTYVADSSTGKISKTAAGGTTATVVASGFSSPSAVAVDGAGDLYVGDSGINKVVEVPYANGTYGTAVVLETGLSGPTGLAIDGVGNLYIADSGNSRVLLYSPSGDPEAQSLVSTVGSGFTTPVAVAIDTVGNLYVSDAGTGDVVQVAIPTGLQTTILSGLKAAAGVAVDVGGSLYSADSGLGTITRVPSISGVLNRNDETTLGTVVLKPTGIALDNLGNVYATDEADAAVAESKRSAGLLNFGNVNSGASSTTISANVSDGGTAGLTLNTPDYTESGSNAASFAVQTESTCANGAALSSGAACSVAVIFSPQGPGLQTETLAFSSTAQNSATLLLSGSGTQLSGSTLTIAVTSPAGTPAYGQPVTVGATLTPVAGGYGTPTGTVTFYVDSAPQAPVPLTNDTASITLTGLTGGAHVLSASYSGDIDYASSASAPLDITIGTAATTTSVVTVTAPYSSPTSANPGNTVTLSATVAPAVPGTPTGTVVFSSGTNVLGSAPVTASVVNGGPGGIATLTTTTLPLGSYNVTASYGGDANFTGSTSPSAVPLLISNATIGMTASSTALTGDGAPVTLTISSIAGFGQSAAEPGTVSLACGGLPAYAVCSFAPAYATPTQGAPQQIAFTVVTNQPPPIPPTAAGFAGIAHRPGRFGLEALTALCLLVPGVLLGITLRRARRGRNAVWRTTVVLLLLLGGCMAGLSGCGTSGKVFDTPTGTSTITVTATITASPAAPNPPPTQTLTFTLTVN